MKLKQKGFTIVELLIVIVVIAVLAAITLVTFNGIQTRGRNTQTISATKEYVKAVNLYVADNGSYPNATGACLGTGYEYSGIQGRCGGEVTGINENATFNSLLSKYLVQKPQPSTRNLIITSAGATRAGGYYDVLSGGSSARIYYILEGKDANCAAGGSLTNNSSAPDMYCQIIFPNL